MERYCKNAQTVAEYLEKLPEVESITYPGLPGDENYPLAQKYLKGASGVISLVVKGGREGAMKWMNALELVG